MVLLWQEFILGVMESCLALLAYRVWQHTQYLVFAKSLWFGVHLFLQNGLLRVLLRWASTASSFTSSRVGHQRGDTCRGTSFRVVGCGMATSFRVGAAWTRLGSPWWMDISSVIHTQSLSNMKHTHKEKTRQNHLYHKLVISKPTIYTQHQRQDNTTQLQHQLN